MLPPLEPDGMELEPGLEPEPGLELEPLLDPPVLEPLRLPPLAFIAASNSVRLICPLPSASARPNSRPGMLAASDRST